MEFLEHHCQLGLYVKGTRIPIEDLKRLEIRVVAATVLWTLGNQALHHITWG